MLMYIYFDRSLPFSISNVDLSVPCQNGRPHHISPCSGGKAIDYLFCFSHILTLQLTKHSYVQLLTLPVLASYPFFPSLSGFGLMVVVNCASFLKNTFSVSAPFLFRDTAGFHSVMPKQARLPVQNMLFKQIFQALPKNFTGKLGANGRCFMHGHYLCQ
jgi:hypothetical protein